MTAVVIPAPGRGPVVAVIPARAGSKGVKDKNLRTVGGKTLVQRAIEHAKESGVVDRILVTSDSAVILIHAENCGAEPILRPDYLANDTASGDEVIIHALEAIGAGKDVDDNHLTVFLQPTSPLRPPGLIKECVREITCRDSIFTATEGHFTWKKVSFEDDPASKFAEYFSAYRYVPAVGDMSTRKMRQNLSQFERPYHENGAVYVSRTAKLIKERNRVCGVIGIVLMEPEDAIDIDTEYDLWLANRRAEYLFEHPHLKQQYVVGESGLQLVTP